MKPHWFRCVTTLHANNHFQSKFLGANLIAKKKFCSSNHLRQIIHIFCVLALFKMSYLHLKKIKKNPQHSQFNYPFFFVFLVTLQLTCVKVYLISFQKEIRDDDRGDSTNPIYISNPWRGKNNNKKKKSPFIYSCRRLTDILIGEICPE